MHGKSEGTRVKPQGLSQHKRFGSTRFCQCHCVSDFVGVVRLVLPNL